jgi:hypothetical protein
MEKIALMACDRTELHLLSITQHGLPCTGAEQKLDMGTWRFTPYLVEHIFSSTYSYLAALTATPCTPICRALKSEDLTCRCKGATGPLSSFLRHWKQFQVNLTQCESMDRGLQWLRRLRIDGGHANVVIDEWQAPASARRQRLHT